jgi:hypothetical protein
MTKYPTYRRSLKVTKKQHPCCFFGPGFRDRGALTIVFDHRAGSKVGDTQTGYASVFDLQTKYGSNTANIPIFPSEFIPK